MEFCFALIFLDDINSKVDIGLFGNMTSFIEKKGIFYYSSMLVIRNGTLPSITL